MLPTFRKHFPVRTTSLLHYPHSEFTKQRMTILLVKILKKIKTEKSPKHFFYEKRSCIIHNDEKGKTKKKIEYVPVIHPLNSNILAIKLSISTR